MTENNFIARISKLLRKENNLQLAIAAVAVVALVVFILTTVSGNGNKQPTVSEDNGNTTANTTQASAGMEARLEQILSQVQNAGEVKVMVTYETGPEIVPAVKTDTQNNSSDDSGTTGQNNNHTTSTIENSEPVVVQGKNGNEALVLKQKEPVVLGVLVVAEGASDLEVRFRLIEAVQVALQITPDRIEVLPMNISNSKEGK
jgi:stage III sporulation protein AG